MEEVQEIIRKTPDEHDKIISALDYIKNDTWKLSENPLHDISEIITIRRYCSSFKAYIL